MTLVVLDKNGKEFWLLASGFLLQYCQILSKV